PLLKGVEMNLDRLEGYKKGEWPRGGSKPWQIISMVYGVTYIVDRFLWVAIRINLKQHEIHIYDSSRPS
ncbi:hypothetical protein MKX01_040255, partial [Papaver californicum]